MINTLVGQWWFWLAIVLAVVVILLVAVIRKLIPVPPGIKAQHVHPGEKLVTLFGDSITEGMMSCNYVNLLAQRMEGESYHFMNAGVGGDTAYNLLNRLRPIVESQPYAIVIMVGTNDISAYMHGGYLPAFYQRMKKLPRAVTLEWYTETLRQIVVDLQRDTSAHIALGSIPILGEQLDSIPNQDVRLFNGAIQALADELGVAYLPVHETMEQYLHAHQAGPGQGYDEARSMKWMGRSMWDHNICGRSWDEISAGHGLVLMTDTIHFNSRGAAIIADLIEGWLLQFAASSDPGDRTIHEGRKKWHSKNTLR
jgi:lysophospholipase L1-like esterase